MEINNNISAQKVIKPKSNKQPEKMGFWPFDKKEDTFQKTYDVDTVMKSIDGIKYKNGDKKFRYEKIVNEVKEILTAEPKKCEYALKLAPQDNITQLGFKNILKKPIEELKQITEIVSTKNNRGGYKFSETDVAEIFKNCTVEERGKIKELSTCALEGDNILKVAKEKDLDIKKVAQKANEMAGMFSEDELIGVTFARDKFSKGDYTCKAESYNRESFTEILDKNLNRYALESCKEVDLDKKSYKIKKVTDYRNHTTAKTRYEKVDGDYQVTHEIRIIKDKNGKVQRTEYTEPSQIKGVMDIKYMYPNGEVKQVSSGKIDPKTGIMSIKKDMVSSNGTRTEYLFEDDPQGNRISDYKITDKNGKVLLQNSESFEVISPNKFISSKNNEKYEITADDDSVTVTDMNNPENTAKFEKGETSGIIGDQEEIIKVLKKMPGEELLKLSESVKTLDGTTNVLESYSQTDEYDRLIHTGDDLFVILHELGHAVDLKYVDMENEEATIDKAIFQDKKFNEIYDKEKEAFNKAFPDAQRNHIAYFIDHETHYGGVVGGKRETIAEANALLTTAKSHEVLAMRSQYLQQHFPETIAYLHEKLNSDDGCFL